MCNISIGFRSGMVMRDYAFGNRCMRPADRDNVIILMKDICLLFDLTWKVLMWLQGSYRHTEQPSCPVWRNLYSHLSRGCETITIDIHFLMAPCTIKRHCLLDKAKLLSLYRFLVRDRNDRWHEAVLLLRILSQSNTSSVLWNHLIAIIVRPPLWHMTISIDGINAAVNTFFARSPLLTAISIHLVLWRSSERHSLASCSFAM